mgnify:CR=1 FL=1
MWAAASLIITGSTKLFENIFAEEIQGRQLFLVQIIFRWDLNALKSRPCIASILEV